MDITTAEIAVSQPNYFIHQVDSTEESQAYRHNLAKAFEQTLTEHDCVRQLSLGAASSAEENATKVGEQEYIATYLRIRPLLEEEKKEQGSHEYFTVEDDKFVVTHPLLPTNSNRIFSHAQRELYEPQKFEFKRVFNQETTQETIFEQCVSPLVNSMFVDGVTMNPLFLTYGETSSGKSFTVFGNNSQPGVVPRALGQLFERIRGRLWTSSLFRPAYGAEAQELSRAEMEVEQSTQAELLKAAIQLDAAHKQAASKKSNLKDYTELGSSSSWAGERDQSVLTYYQVWMSFLEIYNETIFDLLDSQVRPIRNAVRHGQRSNSDTGTAMTFAESVKRTTVELRTDKRGFVWPRNARYALVSSLADAEKFVELARANLQISKTALNAASSRSHAVFTIKLIKVPVCADPYVKDLSGGANELVEPQLRRCAPVRVGSIAFCDLAGSERASKAHSVAARDAVSARIMETGNINTSLLTLKICIDTLRYNQRVIAGAGNEVQKLVPYRASKLTRLFSNYFCFDRNTEKAANSKAGQKSAGFNSQIVILTTIAPSAKLFNESVQILDFATIAKEVISSTVKADEPIPMPLPLPESSEDPIDLRKVKAIAIVPSARSRESIAFENDVTARKPSSAHDLNVKRLERVEEDAEDEDEYMEELGVQEAMDMEAEVQSAEEELVLVAETKKAVLADKLGQKATRAGPFQPVVLNAMPFKHPAHPVGVRKVRNTTAKAAPSTRGNSAENAATQNDAQAEQMQRLLDELSHTKTELERVRNELHSEKNKNSRLRAESERQESRLRQELFVHYDKIIKDQRARYERRIELLCDRLEEHNEQRIESLQQAFRRREQHDGRAVKRRRTSLETDTE